MHRMEVTAGSDITSTIANAISAAAGESELVEFEFNGVTVQVASDSNPDLIYRDWERGMSGFHNEAVRPYPPAELSLEQRKSDAEIDAANKRRWKAMEEESRRKSEEAQKRLDADLATAGAFAVRDASAWAKWQANNQDGYGKGVLDFAENWGRLMQQGMAEGRQLADIADLASRRADVDGITGFMYGEAVSVLASCWEHGEELRLWHNLKTQIRD